MRRYLVLALLTAEIGCATVGIEGPDKPGPARPNPFPTREALDKIAEAPPPEKLTREGGVDAPEWQLTGPLPDAVESTLYSDGSPWQALLVDAVGPRAGLVALPASMRCVAREHGLFLLAKNGMPGERLAHFINARCGAIGSDTVVAPLFDIKLPAGISDEQLIAHYRPQLIEELQKAFKGGPQVAGIWYGRQNNRAVLTASVATRRANLEPVPLVPAADGTVVVRGEVVEPAEHIEAVFNRGHFGYGRCDLDPNVRLPHFTVICKLDPSDAVSALEIAAFPTGRIVGPIVAMFMVWPAGTPASGYHDTPYVTHSAEAGSEAREQLLALINEVRHGAGLPNVTLAARESAVAERVAPHYFAALAGAETELVADQVVLGLRAGWEVDGEVRLGNFTAGALRKSNDLGRLLDALLERPSGRAALLGRSARQVALGTVIAPEQQVIGVVASSYEFFEGANHEGDVQSVLGRLAKARLEQHMRPPTVFAGVRAEVQEAAARVQRGDSSPHQALDRMLNRSAEKYPGVAFRGWFFEGSSLDELTFPPELLRQSLGGIAVAVTHYRPKNEPWSRLVVLILAESPTQTSAARDAFSL
jgi:hypothetical protein